MVTKDTVDEDIYKIQERKSKMNDAIMEKQKSKNESAEMCSLANAAIERFLETSAGST
jgi:SNF2 family DNA or RNA helicase